MHAKSHLDPFQPYRGQILANCLYQHVLDLSEAFSIQHAARGVVLYVPVSAYTYAALTSVILPRPIMATLEVELPPCGETAKQEEAQPADTEILLNDAGRPINAVPSARGAVDSAKGHLDTQPSLCQQVGHMPQSPPSKTSKHFFCPGKAICLCKQDKHDGSKR